MGYTVEIAQYFYRIFLCASHANEGGVMHRVVRTRFPEYALQRLIIICISLYKFEMRRFDRVVQIFHFSCRQIVNHPHARSLLEASISKMRTQKPGSASYEHALPPKFFLECV